MSDKMYLVSDVEINRLLQAFDTLDEAIDYARRLLISNGEEYAQDLVIGHQVSEFKVEDVAEGDDLLELTRGVKRQSTALIARGSTSSAEPGCRITSGSTYGWPTAIAADSCS